MSRSTNKPSHKSFPIRAHFLHVPPHVFCLSVICLPLEIPLTRPNHAEPTDRGARPIIGRPTMSRHWRQPRTWLVRARLSPGAVLSLAALFLLFFFGFGLPLAGPPFCLFLLSAARVVPTSSDQAVSATTTGPIWKSSDIAATSMSAPIESVPYAPRDKTVASDAASDIIRQAVDLVSEAYAECKTLRVASILKCPSVYAHDAITSIALNGEVLYAGAPVTGGAVDCDIVDRIARADPDLYPKTLRINCRAPPLGKFLPHEIYGEPWLANALHGDDVAHCALLIAAMVGKPEWKMFADTATNLRTGKACPRLTKLERVVADAKDIGESGVPLGVACDGVLLGDLLCALEATQATCDCGSDSEKEGADHSFKLVITADECGAGAVCLGPNAWRLGETTADKTVSPGGAVMTTRDVARALAAKRAHPSGADMMSAYDKNGTRIARLLTLDGLVEDVLDGASLDGCDEHRQALSLVLPFVYSLTGRRLRLIAGIVDANTIDAPAAPPNVEATVSLASLEETLRGQDVAWLRRHLGAHWDEARSGHTIMAKGDTFAADACGVWRDFYGRVVGWDAFARLAHAGRGSVAPAVSTPVSWHRMPDIKTHVAHRDPCYAVDMAYGLCRDALQGDACAIDWLRVLSATSPEWAMLDETVARVIGWIDAGCQAPSAEPQWSEPLIDWVLDVAPHQDLGARFDVVREAFDALTRGVLVAKGHECRTCAAFDGDAGAWHYDVCKCASISKDDPRARVACAWKTNSRILIDENTALPYYVDTYVGAAARCLTRTPLCTDGRHMLAVETFCPLLGGDARGVEALVRALYTCEPVRTKIIVPAQLALAERALPTLPT